MRVPAGRVPWVWLGLLGVLIWIVTLLHGVHPLSWDELEYFRATKWTGSGQVPYRDFWEHHVPLQWLLFAPFATWIDGEGTGSVIAMRWAQLPLWLVAIWLVWKLAARVGAGNGARWSALLLLLASPFFVTSAVEYRIDVPGNLLFLGGLALLCNAAGTRRFIAAGALFSLAALANMRMAPLVITTAILGFLIDPDAERWRPRWRSAWMIVSVAIVAAGFVGWLLAAGAWDGFREGVIDYNVVSESLLPPEANVFFERLVMPIELRDLAALALLLFSGAGAALLLRRVAKPSAATFLALVFVASLFSVYALGVQYAYHFQTSYLLMVPLGAFAFERLFGAAPRWRWAPAAVVAAALLLAYSALLRGDRSDALAYQDTVMREVDHRTAQNEPVWDGVGYAIHRPPAYRYWFLAAGVRLMAIDRLIEPYDLEQMLARPPAAIVFNYRIERWLQSFPRLKSYVVRHYVPLYRNLWIPGLSARLGQGRVQARWIAPASGSYEIFGGELLTKHPWFGNPLQYGLFAGPGADELAIPLDPFRGPEGLEWIVDGRVLPPGTHRLDLRRGAKVEVRSAHGAPRGLVVPAGTERLCVAPASPFVF